MKMVRNYIRISNRGDYGNEKLREALDAVRSGRSLNSVAIQYGIPGRTLRRHRDGLVRQPGSVQLGSIRPTQCDSIEQELKIPDLAERMPTPDLSMLLEKAKMTPRRYIKQGRDFISDQASCSDYTSEVDLTSHAYHVDNDAEEEFSINQSEEEISSAVNESLNGPYLLKKETHCTTILDQLLRDDTYTDVTLTAEGQNIRAHKVVLSLSSGYFRAVLDKDSNARNVVFFKDLKFEHLKNIINFIYTGEATIDAGELESFMNTAQMLEISSLADGYKNLPKVVFKKPTKSAKRSAPSTSSPKKSQKVKSSALPSRGFGEEMTISPEIKAEPDDTTADDVGYDNQQDEFESDAKPDITKFLYAETYSGEDNELFPPETIANNDKDLSSPSPGKCPFCSHVEERKSFSDLLKHLLVNHPGKPAYPCESCYCIYVKRNLYTNHKKTCDRS